MSHRVLLLLLLLGVLVACGDEGVDADRTEAVAGRSTEDVTGSAFPASPAAPTQRGAPGADGSSAPTGLPSATAPGNAPTAAPAVVTASSSEPAPRAPQPGTNGGGDAQFLANLAAVGLSTPDSSRVVALGRTACDELGAGRDLPAVVQRTGSSGGVDPTAAGAIVGSAVVSFCPQLARALGG